VSPFAQRLVGFGALGVAIVAAGAVFLFDRADSGPPAPPRSAPAAAARPSIDLDSGVAIPDEAASERAMRLVGQARRLADAGKFAEATTKLDEADKAAPGLSATAEARRRIAEMSTPEGQFATQLGRARVAIDNDDTAEAEKALAEAERLRPQAPEVAELRQTLQTAQQKEAGRHQRIVELIASMRQAIARRDFAAADGALNEAARLDVLDPLVDQARQELAQAHEADRR
jgi:tetratricopeptide (TPR) repeat protein